ncbi:unnamed protein product, partial [Linum tenue]
AEGGSAQHLGTNLQLQASVQSPPPPRWLIQPRPRRIPRPQAPGQHHPRRRGLLLRPSRSIHRTSQPGVTPWEMRRLGNGGNLGEKEVEERGTEIRRPLFRLLPRRKLHPLLRQQPDLQHLLPSPLLPLRRHRRRLRQLPPLAGEPVPVRLRRWVGGSQVGQVQVVAL